MALGKLSNGAFVGSGPKKSLPPPSRAAWTSVLISLGQRNHLCSARQTVGST